MKTSGRDRSNAAVAVLIIIHLLIAFLWVDSVRAQDAQPLTIAGLSREEALRRGEKMYREGILPSGEPMQAVVKGDIPVYGTMFTCSSCHQRSGIGTVEGGVTTRPINGPTLYSPFRAYGQSDSRPAYTDKSLARVMISGENPSGKQINDVMPKYFIDGADMEILIFYLKNLSSEKQPGVTRTELHFATVVTEEVSKKDREAMLTPLQAYIDSWGPVDSYMGAKIFTLAVWELKGRPETWRGQLEEYYRKDPVFALLGGITTGEWTPIHRFCEDHKIPAILPITDYPVISDNDWYTLYFSKGFTQEGEAAARYIHGRDDLSKDLSAVQILRNTPAGRALSKAFQETWESYGYKAPEQIMLAQGEAITDSFWRELADKHKNAVVLMWLDAKDLPAFDSLIQAKIKPDMVFISWSLMEKGVYALPEQTRSYVYITYPYTIPQESQVFRAAGEAWLKNYNIPVTNLDIELKMLTLITIFSDPAMMMGKYIYRDNFLDLIDMRPDLANQRPIYPRLGFGPRQQRYAPKSSYRVQNPADQKQLYPSLSFGQGQRYASKGCYIVQLTGGPQPDLIRQSDWVIH